MRFIDIRFIIRWVCRLTTVVFLLLLTACSTAGSNNSALQDAGIPPQQCGAVHAMHAVLSPMDLSMAQGVEDCFWQAFQQCHSATLVFTQSDSEAGDINTFSLQSQNGICKVADSVQHFSTLHALKSPIAYTCSGIQKQGDGLHILSCGVLGTILIPAAGKSK